MLLLQSMCHGKNVHSFVKKYFSSTVCVASSKCCVKLHYTEEQKICELWVQLWTKIKCDNLYSSSMSM
jgi:hypothetical protein